MATRMLYDRILAHFPQKNMRYAFAYGSGVFQQSGHKDMSKNMIDFVFAVDDPEQWHKENIKSNPSHYSFLRRFGASTVAKIQENHGARIYFNTLVPCADRIIKYGVIDTTALVNDLFDWETLYVSGRLHKPVYVIQQEEGRNLETALQSNLQSAMHAALLLLPDEFSEVDLYKTITGLSYTGDFRMTVGEDKGKITNIVKPNVVKFRELYEPVLKEEDHLQFNTSQGTLKQDISPVAQYHHLCLLPKHLCTELVKTKNADGKNRDTEEVLRYMAEVGECHELLSGCITNIVKASSLSQSVKGIFTAGPRKSWKYSIAKLKKMRKSKSQATVVEERK